MTLDDIALQPADRSALYRQLHEAVAGAILRGDLRPGERLPAERDLAHRLGVSRTTVTAAYRELEARGYVRGYIGRGTFVLASGDSPRAPFAWQGKLADGATRALDPTLRLLTRGGVVADAVSFAAGVPALDCFPLDLVRERLDAALRRDGMTALGLAPTEGLPALREAIATRVGVEPEQVLVLTGAQQGLDLIARCLIDPGDTVVLDRPGYLGAIQTFRAAGARLVGWDPRATDMDMLEDSIVRHRPRFLYTNPTFHNPTGHVLSRRRRLDLLALAARHHLPIIEDEPYRDLTFSAPPPPMLRELDTDNIVISLGTFSKTLAAGLRLGWLVAVEEMVDQLALIKGRSDVFSPTLS